MICSRPWRVEPRYSQTPCQINYCQVFVYSQLIPISSWIININDLPFVIIMWLIIFFEYFLAIWWSDFVDFNSGFPCHRKNQEWYLKIKEEPGDYSTQKIAVLLNKNKKRNQNKVYSRRYISKKLTFLLESTGSLSIANNLLYL